nr:MAG TPA: hypothetical protein [Caudoviricetes sp.]
MTSSSVLACLKLAIVSPSFLLFQYKKEKR